MGGFLEELAWRGLVHDQTPGLAERLRKGPITAYVGFDPTAPSLQVGNLVPVVLLEQLRRAGGTPIVLMGGGTGLIGDPSGKQTERPLLDQDLLKQNLAAQERQFRSLLPDGVVLNNATWLGNLTLVDFLRDVGKHFTISIMLQKESVKARLDEGISFTEFSYMLLQAYDFWHLYRSHRCEMQMGASDQWGNITAGIELIRRREGADAHGLCAPLFTTATGAKFGKSGGNAVWLDQMLTAPVQFYNFWVNVEDQEVERCLRMFTFRSQDEIGELMARHAQEPGARIPHHALASDVTEWVRPGTANELRGILKEVFSDIDAAELGRTIEQLVSTTPKRAFHWDRSRPPKPEDLFVAGGLASSKSDARRLLAGKGLYINRRVPLAGAAVSDTEVVTTAQGKFVLLQKGKKTYQPLRITGLE
ncbi:MAG: tyrosine--tRNA ligase [Gemmatimonadetes bacterium]|nr:tyrosine--tRNA ligase [Gemmatimonadota bacterium]